MNPAESSSTAPNAWTRLRRQYQGLPPAWADALRPYRVWLLIGGIGFLLVAAACTALMVWASLRYPHTNPQEAPPVAEARAEFSQNPTNSLAENIRELEYLQRREFFTSQTQLDHLAWVLLFATLFGLLELKVWSDLKPDTGTIDATKKGTEKDSEDALEPTSAAASAPATDDAKSPEISTDFVDALLERFGKDQSALIPILNSIQAKYRYLPEELLDYLQKSLALTRSHIDGVISFYHQYRLKPCGKNLVRVCIGTACHVAGASRIIDTLKLHYKMEKTEDTSPDHLVTIEEVACMGCCMLAPAATVEDKMLAHTGAAQIVAEVARPRVAPKVNAKTNGHAPANPEKAFALCHCSSCEASGSHEVEDALKTELARRGLPAIVEDTTCAGESSLSPVVHVRENDEEIDRFINVTPAQVGELVRTHFAARNPLETARFWFHDMTGKLAHEHSTARPHKAVIAEDEALTAKKRIAAADAMKISPLSLANYQASGGFQALKKATTDMTPEAVIDEILQSGLRGRGGAGFPTGIKWQTVREVGNDPLIVCNGDEGDPGAFMDRMLMENFPYRVLEGMALAAYATGAREGVLYIRAEYPLAIRRIETAIAACEKEGILGEKLGGTDQPFHVRVVSGAGAFVCGEETALLASLEGNRGEPRQRPPFPAQSGAWGRSTLINNVESFCNVPWILRNGAGLFKAASASEERSAGTKTFALAGKVRRPGLIEVPVGTTLREIIEDIGGGVPDGKKIKAVQIGGPSGGCVPASQLDVPIDYDTLQASGSIMGSGGMVVLDEDDCMVDVARYFMDFARRESCGKCAPCRLGTARMFELLTKLCEGRANKKDLGELESLAGTTKAMSLCGLGKTAPNPLLSTLQHFREEYEAHLAGECPAGVCPDLIKYEITTDCVGCTLCATDCPVDAITGLPYELHEIDIDLCIRCDACRQVCPEDAIFVLPIKSGDDNKKKAAAKSSAGDKDKGADKTQPAAKPASKASDKTPEHATAG